MSLGEFFVLLGILSLHTHNLKVGSGNVGGDLSNIGGLSDVELDSLVAACGGLLVSDISGLHGGKEHDLLNVVGIGEEHADSVDSTTPSGSGRKTILKGSDEVLINMLSLKITGILGSSLSLESSELNLGVVELGVSVDNLVIVNEELESFRKTWLRSVPLSER